MAIQVSQRSSVARNAPQLQIQSPPPPPPSPSFSSKKMSNALFLKTLTPSCFKNLLLVFASLLIITCLIHHPLIHAPSPFEILTLSPVESPTTRRQLLFAIASSSSSWPKRKSYVNLWYKPTTTRAFAFVDQDVPGSSHELDPPVIVSGDTSRFPYTFKGGRRAAIRLARVVKEAVDLNETDVRWFLFGDDDTVFVVENLVRTLCKYDHNRWFYIGSNSEGYEQNVKESFDMAFGGGGFAISYPLAKVLAKVLDSCLVRYAHLYGSDARIFSCLAELGVALTHEPGFHQMDFRGNALGFLSAHPLSPLISLHHIDAVDPLFPNKNREEALAHLFKAIEIDPTRILQQTVCYNRENMVTVSVAWGYAIQLFEGNELLPDIISKQKTFAQWRRGMNIINSHFVLNTRQYPKDQCKQPIVFYLESVKYDNLGVWSYYTRKIVRNCRKSKAVADLEKITVFSQKLELSADQMTAPRRQCCGISFSLNKSMVINIRHCGHDELISMPS